MDPILTTDDHILEESMEPPLFQQELAPIPEESELDASHNNEQTPIRSGEVESPSTSEQLPTIVPPPILLNEIHPEEVGPQIEEVQVPEIQKPTTNNTPRAVVAPRPIIAKPVPVRPKVRAVIPPKKSVPAKALTQSAPPRTKPRLIFNNENSKGESSEGAVPSSKSGDDKTSDAWARTASVASIDSGLNPLPLVASLLVVCVCLVGAVVYRKRRARRTSGTPKKRNSMNSLPPSTPCSPIGSPVLSYSGSESSLPSLRALPSNNELHYFGSSPTTALNTPIPYPRKASVAESTYTLPTVPHVSKMFDFEGGMVNEMPPDLEIGVLSNPRDSSLWNRNRNAHQSVFSTAGYSMYSAAVGSEFGGDLDDDTDED